MCVAGRGRHEHLRVQQRGGRAVRRARRLGGRHRGEARRLDRHRPAAGERGEVVGRRDGGARRRPRRVVDLGDEGVVEGAVEPRRVLLRQEAEVERQQPATGRRRRVEGDLTASLTSNVAVALVPRSVARRAVVDARERSRLVGLIRLRRVTGREHEERRCRRAGTAPGRSARRPVPTGLPLGGTRRATARAPSDPARARTDEPPRRGASRASRVGVIVAPAGAAATASSAAATSAAQGATAPRMRLLTRPPEYRRIRATPRPRDAYCLEPGELRASPTSLLPPALLLAARAARAR